MRLAVSILMLWSCAALAQIGMPWTGAAVVRNKLAGYWPLDDYRSGQSQELIEGLNAIGTNSPAAAKGVIANGVVIKTNWSGFRAASGSFLTNTIGGSTNLTISCWVNITNTANNQYAAVLPIKTASSGATGFGIYYTSGNMAVQARSQPSDGLSATDNVSWSGLTNSWVHVVGIVDYPAKTLSLYTNGTLASSLSGRGFSTNKYNPDGTVSNFSIGNTFHGGSTDSRLQGFIDEVRLYTRALTTNEISTLYQLGIP